MKKLIILSFFFSLFIYFVTSPGRTPYDYFTRLSNSFLKGKIYLTEKEPWLNEVVPIGQNKFTFVNPPFPAVLSMPFVLIFKDKFEQQYLAHIIGAVIVVLTMCLGKKLGKKNTMAVWSALLVGVSSIIWFLSSVGSVWYLGQITAAMFLLGAILESLGKKRTFLVGILISMALLSRLQVLPSLIFFTYLIKEKFLIREKLDEKEVVKFLAGLAIFVIFYSLYNYLRFGKPWETGYTLIPGILDEPWFSHGQFSLSYIPVHLKIFLFGMPILKNSIPYIYPSWAGMAIWLTTPAFIFAFWANIKERVVRYSWLAILLIALINFSYGSTGFTQFGYRYAVDFYPFLIFLTIKGVARTGLKWYHWAILVLSIIVNLWGVLWINKFGWVGF